MRAGTDAEIILIAPIDEIVPAFLARARMIGDFVSRQARGGEGVLRRLVKRALRLFIRQAEIAARESARESSACLDGELIEREMIARHRQRGIELVAPRCERLPRPRIDQIEREAREEPRRERDRVPRLTRIVAAAEEFQRRIVERLHAERDAVNAGSAQLGKARGLDRGRIGFERDLEIARRYGQCCAARSISAAAVAGAISEGVPPPKKIEVSSRSLSRRRPMIELARAAPRASAARRCAARTCD